MNTANSSARPARHTAASRSRPCSSNQSAAIPGESGEAVRIA